MEHESMAATAVDPGNAPRSPDLADFGAINDMYVRCMAALDDEEIRRRTAPFTVPEIRSRAGNARARALLDEFGIVVVPGVVDEPECRRAQEAVDALYDRYRALGVPAHEDERVVYQVGPGRLKGYRQFAGSGKTVIRVRGGQDEGVVDIFNCDMALSGELDGVRSSFEAGDVLGVLASKDVKPRNLNVYINRGIARTRGFHVDSYEPQVKAFIYLTDVMKYTKTKDEIN